MLEKAKEKNQGTSVSLKECGADIDIEIVKLAYPQAQEEFSDHLCVHSFIDEVKEMQ